jgi:hypothetical protein
MDYNFTTMKILRSFLALSFIFFAVPAHAYDFTVFGGVQHQGKLTLNSGAQQARNITFDPRNFGVFGARFGHGRVFGGEHTIAYTPNFIDSQTKAVIYNSNLLIQAPVPKVKPYATVGLGSIFTAGDSITDIGNKFAINYGAGVKVIPAGGVGVRFDVRGYTVPSVQDQTLNIIEVSVGVVFSF